MIHIENRNNFKSSRKVIISTDDNPNYYFFMQIISLLWSKIIGYEPIFFLVGDAKEWQENSKKNKIINRTTEVGGSIYLLDSKKISADSRFIGYNLSAIAQISRLVSGCLPLNGNDYILTSDIDMLPINKSYFYQQDMNKNIHLYFANGYKHTRYPICYIGMKHLIWKQVMSLRNRDIYTELHKMFLGLKRNSSNEMQWNWDELYFYKMIRSSPYYKNRCHMIDRKVYKNPGYKEGLVGVPKELPEGRLDRSNWNFSGDINNIIDVHCKRPGFETQNWREIRSVLEILISKEDMSWIDNYIFEFKHD